MINNPENYNKINDWLEIYRVSSDDKERDLAKARIVSNMIPVVKRIANTIARRAYDPIEDMIQAGFIGLLKAIEKYRREKNDNFRIYAGYFIIGEIKHYIRDKMNSIRVPRHIQELTIRINNFTRDLTLEEVQSLTSEDVASALNIPQKAVDMAIQADRRRTVISLEDMYSSDSDHLGYEEILADENYELKAEYEDAKIIFNDIINKLPPDERVIIDMYYTQNMSKKEIAEALVMTPMSVTRRMKQAFDIISSFVAEDSERRALKKGNMYTEKD